MRQHPIQLTGDAPHDVALLRTRIEEQHGDESNELCRMLAHIDHADAGDALRRFAVHESQIVRAAAIDALRDRFDEPETATTLRHGLGDQRPVVVQAALRSIADHAATFRNELRALAAMPNEDASTAWLDVANAALRTLADVCERVDLDLAVRAFADAKLERGGAALLDALMRTAPLANLIPVLEAHTELRDHAIASLATKGGAARLAELAACDAPTVAALAAQTHERLAHRDTPRYVPPDRRLAVTAIRPHKNDGYTSHDYHFADDADLDARVSTLLNEACHVFRMHADGHWRTEYKDKYAGAIRDEIRTNPWLIKRLFALQDRVVTSLTYRAMQLRDGE